MHAWLKSIVAGVAVGLGLLLAAQPVQAQDVPPASPADAPLVTFGHFAPFAADVAGTAVDVRVNGTQVYTDVIYGNFVVGQEFAAGATLVEVMEAGAETLIVSTTNTLADDKLYYLFVIGGANAQPIALRWQEYDKSAQPGKSRITVGHLAPLSSNLSFTAVNICTDAGDLVVGDLRYGDIRADMDFAPGLYDLKITSGAGGCLFLLYDMPPFFLAAGAYSDAFAVGLNGSVPFPPNILTTTGLLAAFNFLPAVLNATVE